MKKTWKWPPPCLVLYKLMRSLKDETSTISRPPRAWLVRVCALTFLAALAEGMPLGAENVSEEGFCYS